MRVAFTNQDRRAVKRALGRLGSSTMDFVLRGERYQLLAERVGGGFLLRFTKRRSPEIPLQRARVDDILNGVSLLEATEVLQS